MDKSEFFKFLRSQNCLDKYLNNFNYKFDTLDIDNSTVY